MTLVYVSAVISRARSLARSRPTDPAFLAFGRGEKINVYSKSAGSRQDLWGGEVSNYTPEMKGEEDDRQRSSYC